MTTKITVTPAIAPRTCQFHQLESGDWFIANDALYIKAAPYGASGLKSENAVLVHEGVRQFFEDLRTVQLLTEVRISYEL